MKYTFTRKQIVNAFNNKILDDDNFLTYLLSTTSKDIPMNQKSLDKGNGIKVQTYYRKMPNGQVIQFKKIGDGKWFSAVTPYKEVPYVELLERPYTGGKL